MARANAAAAAARRARLQPGKAKSAIGSLFMIKRVDRLVAIAVLSSVALTWLTIVGFDAFRIFISELNDVGQGQYTLTKVITYVLLTDRKSTRLNSSHRP